MADSNLTIREILELYIEYVTDVENGFICRECGKFLNEYDECDECDSGEVRF